MPDSSRRWIAGLVRLGLVVITIAIVAAWVSRHLPKHSNLHLDVQAPPPENLGPGDLRIYNTDSSVDMVLVGDRIAAGLSAKSVAEVRHNLDSSRLKDTAGGLGGSISNIVKSTVAGAIGTHAVFPLTDIRDVRYEGGRIIFDWKSGGEHKMFESTRVNGKNEGDSFRPEDAERFIQAVHARKKELGQS